MGKLRKLQERYLKGELTKAQYEAECKKLLDDEILDQQQYLDPLVAQEILKEGASYEPDPDYYGENATKKAKANEAFFVGDITPNESPEKIYHKHFRQVLRRQ